MNTVPVEDICKVPAQCRKSISCCIITGDVYALNQRNFIRLFTTKTSLENARHFINVVKNIACLATIYHTSLTTSTQHEHTHFLLTIQIKIL